MLSWETWTIDPIAPYVVSEGPPPRSLKPLLITSPNIVIEPNTIATEHALSSWYVVLFQEGEFFSVELARNVRGPNGRQTNGIG